MAAAVSATGPTIHHPQPTRAMTDSAIPARRQLGRKSGNALQRQQASSQQVKPDITGGTNVDQPENPEASATLRQAHEQAEAVETPKKPTKPVGWFGR
jgi:hypothetical protein